MKKALIILALLLAVTGVVTACSEKTGGVQERYTPEMAAKNGEVVDVHGRIANLEKLDLFLENVKIKQASMVQITRYTIEGDPIFYMLDYNGQSIKYSLDDTLDRYGSVRGLTVFGEYAGVTKEQGPDGLIYQLIDVQGKKTDILVVSK